MRLELGNHFKLLIVTKISTRVSEVTVYQKHKSQTEGTVSCKEKMCRIPTSL